MYRGKPCRLDKVYDNVIFVVCRQAVAAVALAAMDLSVSDANRLLMLRVADEQRLPPDGKVPNAVTRKAIAEIGAGRGERFASVDAIFADLN